jgi:hypothetical protein
MVKFFENKDYKSINVSQGLDRYKMLSHSRYSIEIHSSDHSAKWHIDCTVYNEEAESGRYIYKLDGQGITREWLLLEKGGKNISFILDIYGER